MKSIHFKTIDSTSSYLKRNHEKYRNYTFVSCDFQTDGHGRMARKWYSNPKENLLFSVLIKDKKLIKKFSSLSLASACAIHNILTKYKVSNVTIKWPNDVFVNDNKIAGILLESISNGPEIDVLVVGIGINVNQTKFEEDLIHKPTSIYIEKSKKVNPKIFKYVVYKEIIKTFNKIKKDDNSYLSIVKNNNYLLNKEVYAEINNSSEIVKVVGINDDNTLKVVNNNRYYNLSFGEITFHKKNL